MVSKVRDDVQNMRHILIVLLGRTPQVLTEITYALAVERGIQLNEIWVLTTMDGHKIAVDALLDEKKGQFWALQKSYPEQCGQIRFSHAQILVAQDQLVTDFRDIDHRGASEAFLSLVLRTIWEKTKLKNTIIHASIAGGRKTMSVYMALVMQMLARENDALYHVLLNPASVEHHPDFFYPTPAHERKELTLSNGMTIDSSKVKVKLVNIPFIRLREHLPLSLIKEQLSFVELLQWAQAKIASLPQMLNLQLDVEIRLVRIGQRELTLPPMEFCIYWHFAERSQLRNREIPREQHERYFEKPDGIYLAKTSVEQLLDKHRMVSRTSGMTRRLQESIASDKGFIFERVLQYISKVNRKLQSTFINLETIELYRISAVGSYGKCYGLKLDGRLIHIEQ